MTVTCALILSVPTIAAANALTVEWDPPIDPDTAGYMIWYGTASRNYTKSVDVGFTFAHRVTNLTSDTRYCFAVQAYDNSGRWSELSTEVCARTPAATSSPSPTTPATNPGEIVLHAWKGSARGHWSVASRADAAGGRVMRSSNTGWSSTNTARSAPTHFFDLQFDAKANTPYRVWLRLRAKDDSKWNDSVWVQFSGARVNGSPAYQIGSTNALLVNLERCNACGTRAWGWFNSAYWLSQPSIVTFAANGTQTLRVQTREDGVEIDQIVLSPVVYRTKAPGPALNDTTILSSDVTSPSAPSPAPVAGSPYKGTLVSLPGTVQAARFDEGGAGVAYFDASRGNAGGAFRSTDVDLQRSSEGGYNVGWTAPGEWLTYTVNVPRSGTYTARLRVAAPTRSAVDVAFSAPSSVSKRVAVPSTGGWQRWQTVSVPISLKAGVQVVRISFPGGGVNLLKMEVR